MSGKTSEFAYDSIVLYIILKVLCIKRVCSLTN